jgi:hypothetical protein
MIRPIERKLWVIERREKRCDDECLWNPQAVRKSYRKALEDYEWREKIQGHRFDFRLIVYKPEIQT